MKININRKTLIEKLEQCLKFTTGKTVGNNLLRGVLIKGHGNKLNFYATNLSFFIHTIIDIKSTTKEFQAIIEPIDLIEYLNCIEKDTVDIEISEGSLIISQDKSRGTFPLISGEDFPLPPEIKEEGMVFDAANLRKNIPLLILSASKDDSRPVLTSINFIVEEEKLTMVSTDGFRLSVVHEKTSGGLRSMLISAEFLNNVIQTMKDKNPTVYYLSEEKTTAFQIEETTLYTRLIEGDFPPYEKVIPADKKTTITVDRRFLLKSIKQMAVFVKNSGGIIVVEAVKGRVEISPKGAGKNNNYAEVEGLVEGDDQRVAFNCRFLIDLLNHVDGEVVKIEILRPDAPVLFRDESRKNFFHIIMPVRMGE